MIKQLVGDLHLKCSPPIAVRLIDKPLSGYPDLANRLSKKQDFGIKVAAPIGNLFGQVLFGWLADIVGRKRMCK